MYAHYRLNMGETEVDRCEGYVPVGKEVEGDEEKGEMGEDGGEGGGWIKKTIWQLRGCAGFVPVLMWTPCP